MSEVSIILTILMLGIILMSVLGNLLVVFSVLLVRALRKPSNLLLLALAVTDLLVSLLVMPGALLQQLVGEWPLNDSICIAWVFADVFLCTSSILSLTAICIDRYLAISRPLRYVPVRTPRLIGCWIIGVNITAGLVSAPVIPAWNSTPDLPASSNSSEISTSTSLRQDPVLSTLCLVPQSPIYQLYATIVAFYLPLSVILVLNAKVYIIARRIIDREKKSPSMSRQWVVEKDNCHYKERTRSFQDISTKVKPDKPISPAFESVELTQVIDYDDLLVQTYSKDIKFESETAKMIFKDISDHKLSDKDVKGDCNKTSSDDKHLTPKDHNQEEPVPDRLPADISSCKSVSVLNACQVLRLSDTSYCIRLANKQKCSQLHKKTPERPAAPCAHAHACHQLDDQRTLIRTQEGEVERRIEKDGEENTRTPLDKITASTVNQARKLSMRLKQIKQGEGLSAGYEGCDNNCDTNAREYLTLVVSDNIADTEHGEKTSKHETEKSKQKVFSESFENGFPKSPSGRLTKYLSGSYARQEWKATLTVGLVVLTFLICWLPFFVLALVRPLAPHTLVPDWVSSLTLWLGYTNSMLNPIIYGVLHRDFRKTFIDLLSCNIIRDYYRAYKMKY